MMTTPKDGRFEDISVDRIVILSGIRPKGRVVHERTGGRSSHGFFYIWSGEATFFPKGKKPIKVTEGQLFYIPRLAHYRMEYTAESSTFVLVNFELFDRQGKDLFLAKDFSVFAEDDEMRSIAGVMAKFEMCGAAQNAVGSFRKKELFYRLLSKVYLGSDLFRGDEMYPQILEGVLLLKQSYLENIPIEVFAKQSNVSISTFRQLFHKQYGMSPLQYRNRLRINRAVQLMEGGECTVAEASYASGFENIGYFCRYYKRVTGESPGQTKKRKRYK